MPPSPTNRRRFLRAGISLPLLGTALSRAETPAGTAPAAPVSPSLAWKPADGPLRLGLMADCQYAPVASPSGGKRQFLFSPQKLADAIGVINTFKPHLNLHLGDFIDRDHRSLAVVRPILKNLAAPVVHLIGNHDFEVTDELKKSVWTDYGLPAPYHEMSLPGWRFLFLDGNQNSLHRHPKTSAEYAELKSWLAKHQKDPARKLGSFADYNGALGDAQHRWLAQRLDEAREARQRVILFCHYPVLPANPHNLWDADAVVALIARQPHVMGWVNGHNHDGNYLNHNGIHFWNLRGMVDTTENAFATAELSDEALVVKGYGREPSRRLVWRKVEW